MSEPFPGLIIVGWEARCAKCGRAMFERHAHPKTCEVGEDVFCCAAQHECFLSDLWALARCRWWSRSHAEAALVFCSAVDSGSVPVLFARCHCGAKLRLVGAQAERLCATLGGRPHRSIALDGALAVFGVLPASAGLLVGHRIVCAKCGAVLVKGTEGLHPRLLLKLRGATWLVIRGVPDERMVLEGYCPGPGCGARHKIREHRVRTMCEGIGRPELVAQLDALKSKRMPLDTHG